MSCSPSWSAGGRVVVMGVLPEPAAEQVVVRERAEPARRERGQARWRGAAGDPGREGLAEGERGGEPRAVAAAGHPQTGPVRDRAGYEPAVGAHREQPAAVL